MNVNEKKIINSRSPLCNQTEQIKNFFTHKCHLLELEIEQEALSCTE